MFRERFDVIRTDLSELFRSWSAGVFSLELYAVEIVSNFCSLADTRVADGAELVGRLRVVTKTIISKNTIGIPTKSAIFITLLFLGFSGGAI